MCIKFSLTFKNQCNSQKRQKKYVIVSIDKNKAFNKIQHSFMILKVWDFFIGKASPTWSTYIFYFQSPFSVTKSKLFEFAKVNVVVEHWWSSFSKATGMVAKYTKNSKFTILNDLQFESVLRIRSLKKKLIKLWI